MSAWVGLMALNLVATARDEPSPAPLFASQRGVSGRLLLGADHWAPDTAGHLDAMAGAWIQKATQTGTLSLSGGWRARAWTGGTHYQDIWFTGQYRSQAPLGMGPALSISGSPEGRWAEAAPSVAFESQGHGVARLGPVTRIGSDASPMGLRGGGYAAARGLGGRRVDARGDATLWLHPDLPLVDLQGRITATLPLASKYSAQLLLHGSTYLGPQSEAPTWTAGVSPPGRTLAGAGLAGERALGSRARLRMEMLAEQAFGVFPQSRATLLVGLVGARTRVNVVDWAPTPTVHRFRLVEPTAKIVTLAGSFNDWSPEPLNRSPDGVWTIERTLPSGVHTYIYLVDGEARVPPEAVRTEPDGFGGSNGVIIVSDGAVPEL